MQPDNVTKMISLKKNTENVKILFFRIFMISDAQITIPQQSTLY